MCTKRIKYPICVIHCLMVFSLQSISAEVELIGGLEDTPFGIEGTHINDIEVNADGDLYIATHSRILKFIASGQFELVSGNGEDIYTVDHSIPFAGSAIERAISPRQLAFSPNGDLYFVDATFAQGIWIRKVDTEGNIYPIAGNGAYCYYAPTVVNNGCYNNVSQVNASNSSLPSSIGTPLTVDSQGNVYITGQVSREGYEVPHSINTSVIYKVTPNGILTSFTGKLQNDPGLPSTILFKFNELLEIYHLHWHRDNKLYFWGQSPLAVVDLELNNISFLHSIPDFVSDFIVLDNSQFIFSRRKSESSPPPFIQEETEEILYISSSSEEVMLSEISLPQNTITSRLAYDEKRDILYVLTSDEIFLTTTSRKNTNSLLWRIPNALQSIQTEVETWLYH